MCMSQPDAGPEEEEEAAFVTPGDHTHEVDGEEVFDLEGSGEGSRVSPVASPRYLA